MPEEGTNASGLRVLTNWPRNCRRFREGRPIHTRPSPWWEQTWKWARRQPARAGLIVVSVLALMSLLLYLDQRARGAQHALREEQRTNDLRDKVRSWHLQAQRASDQGGSQDAHRYLQAALEIIQAEPSLRDLQPDLAVLQEKVDRQETQTEGQRRLPEDVDTKLRACRTTPFSTAWSSPAWISL